MALKRERFFALFFAILFLVTSSALTIAFLVANYQSSHNSSASSTSSKVPASVLNKLHQQAALKSSTQSPSTKLAGTLLSGFTPTANVPSLVIKDLTVGTGTAVKSGATIKANYTGAVAATGVIFQSSFDSGQPVTFPLSNVIAGWQKGIVGMKVGGVRQLLIPANLAYGSNPPQGSGIPSNAALVFNVYLVAIVSN